MDKAIDKITSIRYNFQRWAFRLLTVPFILYVILLLQAQFYTIKETKDYFHAQLIVFFSIIAISLLTGLILLFLSLIFKEKKTHEFYLSLLGYPLCIIAGFYLIGAGFWVVFFQSFYK